MVSSLRNRQQSMKRLNQFFVFMSAAVVLGLCVLLYGKSQADDTLRMVHVLFRHGERSPSKTYTHDPHKEYKWPGGWDQLSNRGKIEEYHLGAELRKRYNDFIPLKYHPDDTIIESSYADRCLMSAQLLLAGLYPPVGDQIWNSNLLWQPIPVHSIPRELDNKIAIKRACKRHLAELKAAYDSERIAKLNQDNLDLYVYLTNHSGETINNISTLETLYNTMEIQHRNNLTLPAWSNEVFPQRMESLAASNLAIFTDTDLMKRLHGGVLAKEILQNMLDKSKNTLKVNRKMVLYSGHDLTVVTLLRVLGFHDLFKPGFGAMVIIELHEINGENIVEFFLKRDAYASDDKLVLQSCGTPCHLQDLQKSLEPVVPTDWSKECMN